MPGGKSAAHAGRRKRSAIGEGRGTDVFQLYVLFLILGGIAMLVIASVKSGQPTTRRVWNAVFGAGFTIYGLYLLLFFPGGHYLIFFYAFILPILMITRFFRDRSAFRARQQTTAFQGPPPGNGQPPGYGQPAGGQPPGPEQQNLSTAQSPGPDDPGAQHLPIRCAECGQQTAEGSQYCALCGAPLAQQRSVAAEPSAGGSGDAIAGHQPALAAGQRAPEDAVVSEQAGRGKLLWPALVIAGLLAVVVAVVVIATNSSSSAPTASSVRQLTVDQLRPGDCLRASNMGLGTGSAWPDLVTAVPCSQQHLAEVFFAGNIWPQSMAYPGDDTLSNQSYDRCQNALTAYVGSIKYLGTFTFDFIAPDRTTWPSGDRSVQCVAYTYTLQSVNYSIKTHYH